MCFNHLIGLHKTEIDTPALLLYIDTAEKNILKMADFFKDKECKLRPHVKTHKLPLIAKKQIAAGAIGITCATTKEAEVFLESGIRDILIANQVVGDKKITKIVELSQYGNIIVCVENYENVNRFSEIAKIAGVKINVAVEVNVGLDRCGINPGKESLEFVRRISKFDNIILKGLVGYEGGVFTNDLEEKKNICKNSNRLLVETKELIENSGFPIEIVSAGGSNTYQLTGIYPGITDVQVGSYVTMDSNNKFYGVAFEHALTILSTVKCKTDNERLIVDAGMKSISTDMGKPICKDKGLSFFQLDEEHGHIKTENENNNIQGGNKIEIIPSHGCTTIPLYDYYFVIRNNFIESVARILPRGDNQDLNENIKKDKTIFNCKHDVITKNDVGDILSKGYKIIRIQKISNITSEAYELLRKNNINIDIADKLKK